ASACVIDCSREAATDADFLLTVDLLRQWERRHGRIAAGSWVLMRTDWSKRTDPVAYQNLDETGQHTPGPDTEAVRFLVDERLVLGFGSEAIGTDAGQAFHLRPPYPCHYYMHGSGRDGLQCLTNLDLLPRRAFLQMVVGTAASVGASGRIAHAAGDAVTIGWPNDVPSWDPNQRFTPDAQPIFKAVFDQPIDQDPQLKLIPHLIKRWDLA